MIIDAHAHVFACPKIKPRPGTAAFMSAAEQIRLMDSNGIDKAVIMPLNNAESPAENQSIGELLYICRTYPDRFIPFCNVDPRLPRRPDLIRTEDFEFILNQYRQLGCKGLGEITARIYWDDPSMLRLLEACMKVGFPVTFHSTTEEVNEYGVLDRLHLPLLEKVLKMFPDLKFIGHSPGFWSEISGDITLKNRNGYPGGPVKPGGRIQALMRKYNNLHADLSACSGFNALKRDSGQAFRFIDEFQDRLLFGLDCVCPQSNIQLLEWFNNACNQNRISSNAYEKIMWKNSDNLFNLRLKHGLF